MRHLLIAVAVCAACGGSAKPGLKVGQHVRIELPRSERSFISGKVTKIDGSNVELDGHTWVSIDNALAWRVLPPTETAPAPAPTSQPDDPQEWMRKAMGK